MKNKAAQQLGKLGGEARSAKLSQQRKNEIAFDGGKARQEKRALMHMLAESILATNDQDVFIADAEYLATLLLNRDFDNAKAEHESAQKKKQESAK